MARNTESLKTLMDEANRRAQHYLSTLPERPVQPSLEDVEPLREFGGALADEGMEACAVLERLDTLGSPGTVACAGPRYFGFVTGGALPAALACQWLAGAWDQNAAFVVGSPAAAAVESAALGWILDALGLRRSWGGGFVTGTTMGNVASLVVARDELLRRAGWSVAQQGLFGAPPITVIVGDEAHSTLFYALGFAGLGSDRVIRVAADGQGRMKADALPAIDGPTIVCLQAGNVNSGGFDPIAEIASQARKAGAWIHLDGAFGLWAAAAPKRRHLTRGLDLVDSVATDLHKWLNVPYDSGLTLYRQPEVAQSTLALRASYLPDDVERQPCDYTPEASRRARGVEAWAAMASLGRHGLADMIERNCRLATRFAEGFRLAGYPVLNEVVLNQVLVSFGGSEATTRVIDAVQLEGTCWCGGTVWQGQTAMRVSVSSWATTEEDVDSSLDAIVRIAKRLG